MEKKTLFLNQFETPCIILPSHLGQLLYSPVELNTRIDEPVLALADVADLVNKDFGMVKIDDLCKKSSQSSFILAPRGNNGSAVNSSGDGLFIDTKAGRKFVSIQQFIERMKLDTPAAVISMVDEVCVSDVSLVS